MNYYRKPGPMSKGNPVIKCKPYQTSVSLLDFKNIPNQIYYTGASLFRDDCRYNIKAKSNQTISKLACSPTKVYSFYGKNCNYGYHEANATQLRKLTVQSFEETSRNFYYKLKQSKALNFESKLVSKNDQSVQNATSATSKMVQSVCNMVSEQAISCDIFHEKLLPHNSDKETNTKVLNPSKLKHSITQTETKDSNEFLKKTKNTLDDMFGNYQKYLLSRLEQESINDRKPISMVELFMVLNDIMFDLRQTTNAFMFNSGFTSSSNIAFTCHHPKNMVQNGTSTLNHKPNHVHETMIVEKHTCKESNLINLDDMCPLMIKKQTSQMIRKNTILNAANQSCNTDELPPSVSYSSIKHSSQCCCIDCITK